MSSFFSECVISYIYFNVFSFLKLVLLLLIVDMHNIKIYSLDQNKKIFAEVKTNVNCLYIGLTISPNTSLKKKGIRRSAILTSNPSTPTTLSEKSEVSVSSNMIRQRRPDSVPPCYQVSSLNEGKARTLCRRSPIGVIKYP